MAVSEALQVLNWWELPEEEQPPPEIWGVDTMLKQWWADVKLRRDEKYGTAGSDGPDEVVPQTQNEYATQMLKGM